MSHLFPRHDTMVSTFGLPQKQPKKPASYRGRPDLYSAFSVVDDAKNKANKLSAEATSKFEKASAKAQAKTGKIELFSGQYYAACTIGGLLACVSAFSTEKRYTGKFDCTSLTNTLHVYFA